MLYVFPIFFLVMWLFLVILIVRSAPPVLLLVVVGFLGVRSVLVAVWSVLPLPILPWMGVPAVCGPCDGLGGAIVDLGNANLPTPTRFLRYGFGTFVFHRWFCDVPQCRDPLPFSRNHPHHCGWRGVLDGK